MLCAAPGCMLHGSETDAPHDAVRVSCCLARQTQAALTCTAPEPRIPAFASGIQSVRGHCGGCPHGEPLSHPCHCDRRRCWSPGLAGLTAPTVICSAARQLDTRRRQHDCRGRLHRDGMPGEQALPTLRSNELTCRWSARRHVDAAKRQRRSCSFLPGERWRRFMARKLWLMNGDR